MTAPEPTILLVEDNEMNRDMLVRRLQRAGYRVATAGDSEIVFFAVAIAHGVARVRHCSQEACALERCAKGALLMVK